ncbi:MAG: hypothetical protein WB679_15760, partial [Terracidiphilus sp.]
TFSSTPAYTTPPPAAPIKAPEPQVPAVPAQLPLQASKPPAPRTQPASHTHLSRPAHNRNRKASANRPGQSASGARIFRRTTDARPSAARTSNGPRPPAGSRWSKNGHTSSNGKTNGSSSSKSLAGSARSNGTSQRSNGNGSATRNGKSATTPAWGKHNGHAKVAKTTGKPSAIKRKAALTRKDVRIDARTSRTNRKPALAAGAKAGNSKRFGFTARASKGTKKRG